MPIPRRPCHHGRTVPLPLHLVLVLLLSLLCPTKAQPSGSTSQDQYGNLRGSFGPSMGIIIIILVTAFFFMVFFSIYLRRCSERADLSVRPSGTGARALEGARSRRSEAARGLDSAVVQALPTLVYAEVKEHKIGKGALECAICLNEFEDDEALRLLPSCDHVFHTHCIDAWLSSHTTCPVCRCNLAAPDPNTTEAAVTTASPQAAGASDATIFSEETDHEREGGAGEQQNHVAIVVDETGEQQDQLRRMESKSRLRWRWSRSMPRMPRSHSTGHSVGVAGQGDDCERYTLRLPEHIRKDVMAGKFQGSSSSVAGESKRHPVGGEGTSHGGRSFKLRRWEWAAKSDRWAFFTRTLSMVVSRGDDSGVGEGSSRKGGDGGRGRGIRQGEDVAAV